MANIKSAKKRIDITKRNNERNKSNKSEIKTQTKKCLKALEAGDIEKAEKLLPETFAVIDSKVTKGTIHKNSANRRKSILASKIAKAKANAKPAAKKVEKAAPAPAVVVEEAPVAKKPAAAKKTTTKATAEKSTAEKKTSTAKKTAEKKTTKAAK